MMYDEESNEYTLSSGKRIAANNGILGLGPEPDALVTEGYDGRLEEDFGERRTFTPEERHEIAREMVRRWTEWGRRT